MLLNGRKNRKRNCGVAPRELIIMNNYQLKTWNL